MTGVLVRERLHETHRCRRDLEQRRHEKMDAEIGENYKPRTPRIVLPPASRREAWKEFSLRTSRRKQPC